MESKPKVYLYHTAVKWTEQRKGVISCAGKPDVPVATPPEFKGHDGIWSPEDLFVASANICLMTTFLAVAERAGLAFAAYESTAEGRLELVEGKFQFTAITIKPTITLLSLHGEDPETGLTIDPPSHAPAPDADLLNAENAELVRVALDQLEEPCREISELRYFGDLSYEELSVELKLNPKTVSSRLSKCLDRLEAVARKIFSGEKTGVSPSN